MPPIRDYRGDYGSTRIGASVLIVYKPRCQCPNIFSLWRITDYYQWYGSPLAWQTLTYKLYTYIHAYNMALDTLLLNGVERCTLKDIYPPTSTPIQILNPINIVAWLLKRHSHLTKLKLETIHVLNMTLDAPLLNDIENHDFQNDTSTPVPQLELGYLT